MQELIIRKNEETIYIIRKDKVQQVVHNPKMTYEGFTMYSSPNMIESYTPTFTHPEEWYVVMDNGNRYDLTKKQYKIIKGWF